jgi:hypothetical protein
MRDIESIAAGAPHAGRAPAIVTASQAASAIRMRASTFIVHGPPRMAPHSNRCSAAALNGGRSAVRAAPSADRTV